MGEHVKGFADLAELHRVDSEVVRVASGVCGQRALLESTQDLRVIGVPLNAQRLVVGQYFACDAHL